MERKIGEVFTYNGKTYQVVKGNRCTYCDIGNMCILKASIIGPCLPMTRSDKTNVVFKEINNMEIKNNQLIIEIPEGMEIDTENSSLDKGIIKFKQNNVTYTDIEDALNLNKNCIGIVASKDNASKLVALNRLMNIAKYYNKCWKPNWEDDMESKYFITFKWDKGCYDVTSRYKLINNQVHFKREEDAQAVIDNPNFRDILDAIYKN